MILLGASARPAAALDPARGLGDCTVEVWGLRDGLTGSMVRSLAQTEDGYLWIAGFGGVTRYDGARIIRLGIEPPLDVMGMVPGTDGTLRIVPRRGPIVCTRNGLLAACPPGTPQLPGAARIFAVHRTARGEAIIASDQGLLRQVGDRFVVDAKAKGFSLDDLMAMHLDHAGRLWMGGAGGLYREGERGFERVGEPGTPSVPVRSFFETPDRRLWILTDARLLLMQGDRTATIALPPELAVGTQSKVIEDRDGNVWIGGGKGLARYRHHEGKFVLFTMADGLPDDAISALLEDREGSLWVGTRSGSLAQFTDRTVPSRLGPPRLNEESIEGVCEDSEGAMWFGYRLGLLRWKDGQERLYNRADGLPSDRVYTMVPARGGGLWVGAAGGLARFQGGRIDRPVPLDAPIYTLHEDVDGALYIGTDRALLRLEDGKLATVPIAPGFTPLQIRGLGRDDRGVLWVSSMGGLGFIENGQLRPADPAVGAEIASADRGITRDQDGTLWFGAGTSLVRRRGGRFHSYAPALGPSRDWMFQVLPDDHGYLWFGTSWTLSRAARSTLDELAATGRRTLPVVSFDITDSRGEIAARRARNAGAWKSRDGRLWFATLSGVVTVEPTKIRTNPRPPSVLIERATVDGRPAEAGGEFPPGPGNLEFHYAGVTLVEPRKAQHRYRLEGFDRDWVDAGTRRVAYYTNIPPGEYRFRVQASNADGAWNEAGATLPLRLTPHFWQTGWFYALVTLCLGGIAVLLYRARLGRLRGQYLAVFAERSRVARELHDSLLQGMSAVALEVANVRAALPSSAAGPAARLEAVEDALTQSLEETRRFVWNLREQPTGAGDLGLALTRLAGRLTEGRAVACPVTVEGIAVHLSHDAQGTLFRIAQEAITNALRHADASVINVELRYHARDVELHISDDGRGFDPARASGQAEGHFGLVGMEERARRLGARLVVDSQPGAGTRITFTLPLTGKPGAAPSPGS